MTRSIKMQRALEVVAADNGLAYRKAWAVERGFKHACESPAYVGLKDGLLWTLEDGEYYGVYVPTVEDILTADWDYEI